MKFRLVMRCDNAAFGLLADGPLCEETARILRAAADRVERGEGMDRFLLVDINGNQVGNAGFIEEGKG